MPKPPDAISIAELRPYVLGIREPPLPGGVCWDTRIAQRNSPEALLCQITGWEVGDMDAFPRQGEDGEPILDQIIHFRKLVPTKLVMARAAQWVELAAKNGGDDDGQTEK
jgi:hypothetical protein